MVNAGIIDAKTGPRGFIKPIVGGMFILAGMWLVVFGWPDFAGGLPKYEKFAELKSSDVDFPKLDGRFAVEQLDRYRIGWEKGSGLELSVARYRDDGGRLASAIVYPTAKPDEIAGEARFRGELWKNAADAVMTHTAEDALFVSWWDDGQRIHFQTGRKPWVDMPPAAAFPKEDQKKFWGQVSGGFDPDETRLKRLSRWLTMDADSALAEMAEVLPRNQPIFLLVCLDDLARLSEIEALSGIKLPIEGRFFPQSQNIHAQIAEVKRWAGEKGVGSYLVQQMPSGGVRAWRITDEGGSRMLLARLLPFTTSLAKPLDNLSLVYQSGWGGYLTVYQMR